MAEKIFLPLHSFRWFERAYALHYRGDMISQFLIFFNDPALGLLR